jgi:hypothetical protein
VLQTVVPDPAPSMVAVVLGEKTGFASQLLIEKRMSVVSVLTGKHNKWGGEETKTSMTSTDISIGFAERIKMTRGEVESGEESDDSEGDAGGGKKGSGTESSDSEGSDDEDEEVDVEEEVEPEGRGRPEDLNIIEESGMEDKE